MKEIAPQRAWRPLRVQALALLHFMVRGFQNHHLWRSWGVQNAEKGIFGHFGHFLKKNLCSRGLHYYGMILLYIWVRFKHFPPLVDFSFLKTPSCHMWPRRYVYLTRLFIFCGYIISEYVMHRKNSINQPHAASVTFHLIMQGFWART